MGVSQRARRFGVVLGVLMLFASVQGLALADGTEMLGAPSVPVAAGSGVAAAGVGLANGPGTISVTVPGTPQQALLYWEVQRKDIVPPPSEDISVDGNVRTGAAIGGPTDFFSGYDSVVYRTDITDLVVSGANTLDIVSAPGVAGQRVTNGAGVYVIYDDGTTAEIAIRDGDDVAWAGALDVTRQTTEAQTFTFAAEAIDRTASLSLFVASVADDTGKPIPVRPTAIDVSAGVVTVTYDNVLDSFDGDFWDTFNVGVLVPAGASSLTVQVKSADNLDLGINPASLVWIGAGLSVPVTPPQGGEGCTPGYWKQSQHFDSWTGYATTDDYEATFGVDASFTKTLLGALQQGGGGEKALGRHATAALLNAASGDVSYAYTTAQVIALVQGAYATGDFEGVKNQLAAENEMGCPLS